MQSRRRQVARWVLGIVLVLQGINHFVMTETMVRMMPAWLPAHVELVWASGVAEIVLGAAAMFERSRVAAGWGILALLVAVYPANINMALNAHAWPDVPGWGLWLRLPFQFVFAWWAWAACIRPSAAGATAAD